MITEDRGLTMLAGANPVPQLDLIDVDVEAAKYLATLEQRSSGMMQLGTKTKDQTDTRRRPKAVLAAALAVVVLVGGGVVLLLVARQESSPVATPPSADPVAIAEAYIEARNAYNSAAMLELLADDVEFSESISRDVAELALLLEGERMSGFQYSPFACQAMPRDGWVECGYEMDSRFQQIIGYPTIHGTYVFVVEDGQITFVQNPVPSEFNANVFGQWADWLRTEHPGVTERLYQDGRPVLSDDVRELHTTYLDLYEDWVKSQQ